MSAEEEPDVVRTGDSQPRKRQRVNNGSSSFSSVAEKGDKAPSNKDYLPYFAWWLKELYKALSVAVGSESGVKALLSSKDDKYDQLRRLMSGERGQTKFYEWNPQEADEKKAPLSPKKYTAKEAFDNVMYIASVLPRVMLMMDLPADEALLRARKGVELIERFKTKAWLSSRENIAHWEGEMRLAHGKMLRRSTLDMAEEEKAPRLDEAYSQYSQAIGCFREAKRPDGAIDTLNSMAQLCNQRGGIERAWGHIREAWILIAAERKALEEAGEAERSWEGDFLDRTLTVLESKLEDAQLKLKGRHSTISERRDVLKKRKEAAKPLDGRIRYEESVLYIDNKQS